MVRKGVRATKTPQLLSTRGHQHHQCDGAKILGAPAMTISYPEKLENVCTSTVSSNDGLMASRADSTFCFNAQFPNLSTCLLPPSPPPPLLPAMSSKTQNQHFPSLAHEKSAPFVIDPAYSTSTEVPPRSTSNGCFLYDEAEVECFRLAVLKKRAMDAKLKVYYPGIFHTPSQRGLFRLCNVASLPEFSFRANGQVVVTWNDTVIYESEKSSYLHNVSLKGESADTCMLLVSVTTSDEPKDEPSEPACLWLSNDSPLSTMSWEWSSDGKRWTYMRIFDSVEGASYPHFAEAATEMHVEPKEQIDNNLFDLDCELFGRVVISCNKSDKAPVIRIGESIAEAMNDDPEHFEQSTTMVATAESDGITTWQSAHSVAFRYVRVVECDNMTEIFCNAQFHPVQYLGAFAASDQVLTKIWMNSAYTLRLCMHDFLLDGIKRDRLPLAVSLLANAFTFADADIVSRSMTVLGMAGIAENDINGIVDYSLWWIICQDLYSLYFGDRRHLEMGWNRIEKALSCLASRCDNDGLLCVNKEADWLFIDWVDCEKTVALQILWWWALDCGSRLAQRMNDNKTVVWIQKHQAKVKVELISSCWDDAAELWLSAPDQPKVCSRHANILSIVSGLTSNGTCQIKEALLNKDLEAVGTPCMKTFECLALARLGATQSALSAARSYWGRMIENGATTFWEAFSEDEQTDAMSSFYDRPYGRSLCHAWSAGPCHLLPETILGIRPLADGWSQWTCSPNAGLEWVSVTVPTPRGCIEVEVSPDTLRVVVPDNTTMVFKGASFPGPDVVTQPRHVRVGANAFSVDVDTVRKWAAPYRGWHYYPDHVIPSKPGIKGFEDVYMTDVPTIYQLPGDSKWYMSFIGFNGKGYQSFVAESNNLMNWTKMRLAMGFGREGEFDFGGCMLGAFLLEDYDIRAPRILKKKDGKYWSLYGAYAKQGEYEIDPGYEGIASSEDGLIWNRAKNESILSVVSFK
jgi:hypothetical protein